MQGLLQKASGIHSPPTHRRQTSAVSDQSFHSAGHPESPLRHDEVFHPQSYLLPDTCPQKINLLPVVLPPPRYHRVQQPAACAAYPHRILSSLTIPFRLTPHRNAAPPAPP